MNLGQLFLLLGDSRRVEVSSREHHIVEEISSAFVFVHSYGLVDQFVYTWHSLAYQTWIEENLCSCYCAGSKLDIRAIRQGVLLHFVFVGCLHGFGSFFLL